MVTKFAPQNYEDTLGRIVTAFFKAPDFYCDPIGRNFTYDEIFGDILYGIDCVKSKTKSPEKLVIIEQVITKLHEARALLEAKNDDSGISALAEAKELFRSLKTVGRKKAV